MPSPIRPTTPQTVRIAELPNYLASKPQDDTTTAKVKQLLKNFNDAAALINERSEAAPGFYADDRNPSYIDDVNTKGNILSQIQNICQDTWNLNVTG